MPITNHKRVSEKTLTADILPFLRDSDEAGSPVVVHCSAGLGRTDHILALWHVCDRGYALKNAIETVREIDRCPLEGTSKDELRELLNTCEQHASPLIAGTQIEAIGFIPVIR